MSSYYFKEEQKLKNSWLWLLLAIIAAFFFAYACYSQLILGKPFGNKPISDAGLIAISIMIPGILIVVYFVFLKSAMFTAVRSDGIYMRYPLFINKFRAYKFDEIEVAVRRDFNPVKQFGGHGIKAKNKNNQSFTVSGRTGIQLAMKTGKQILIGTQKPDDFINAINKAKLRLR